MTNLKLIGLLPLCRPGDPGLADLGLPGLADLRLGG